MKLVDMLLLEGDSLNIEYNDEYVRKSYDKLKSLHGKVTIFKNTLLRHVNNLVISDVIENIEKHIDHSRQANEYLNKVEEYLIKFESISDYTIDKYDYDLGKLFNNISIMIDDIKTIIKTHDEIISSSETIKTLNDEK